MRILILNWRDVRSPAGGGAEILTHEIARRLVAGGHSVTCFTSRPDGLPPREVVDGVEIFRAGSEFSTRLYAPRFARRTTWDVVVEEVNTLPYLSPLWSSSPTTLLINQLAREIWWYEAPKPLASIGYLAEPLYLRAYRNVPKITISRSTCDDLRRLGLKGPIHVISPAASTEVVDAERSRKTLHGRLASIGRLVPSKRADHLIRALAELRRTLPSATLTLVGEGPERGRLEQLARALNVADAVSFAGRLSEHGKVEVLRAADLLVGCSVREGWGLTVTEAARLGTPAVVYDVPGFRDSIVGGRTGVLTRCSPAALGRAVGELLADPARYEQLRLSAWRHAQGPSWDQTARSFERVLVSSAAQRGAASGRGVRASGAS
jgi:glycosyltransferase involved in cell wall biosynthesis